MNKTFTQYQSMEAYLAGLTALGYAYFFVMAQDVFMYSLLLLLTGIFATKVMVALFVRLKEVSLGFALLGLIFGVFGSMGMAVHGGYDLANALNPPAVMNADLPNQLDPRGMLAFGATGLGILYFAWMMSNTKEFPKNLSMLGLVTGVMLIWIYIARLTVLDPTNPILLYPVLLTGFVLSPAWYLWLGRVWSEAK